MSFKNLKNIESISVYEKSSSVTKHRFFSNSNLLFEDIPQTSTNFDFNSDYNEYYDIFVSNAKGEVDPNGSYITIQSYSPNLDGLSANIAAVFVDFKNTSHSAVADKVTHVKLGENLPASTIAVQGFADLALGQQLDVSSILGDGESSITLGFCQALDFSNCSSTIDECGICGGQGESCSQCQETNIGPLKDRILATDQKEMALQLLESISPYVTGSENRIWRYRTRMYARRIFVRALKIEKYELLNQPGDKVSQNCTADNCEEFDNVQVKADINKFLTMTKRYIDKMIKIGVRQSALARKYAKTLRAINVEIHNNSNSALDQLPNSFSICNTRELSINEQN